MKLVYLLPILIVFILTPAFGYNSGFRPIYQPPSAGGSNPTQLYCIFGEFLNSYNSTTNSFTCGAGGGGGENNTASNLGTGNGLFKQKVGVDLQFLSIFCAGDILCSTNSTDLRISYDTPSSSSLKINNQTAQNDFQITGINNSTGIITTNQFSVNSITCSGSDVINSIDNVTGYVICITPSGGSGFDTIASSPQTTATILADNSTITNTATIKTLTQGTGITLTNGSNAVTVATSFEANSLTCSGTDKFSAYDNSTGLYTCTADSSGATAREDEVAVWPVDSTKSNIGTVDVNVYTTGLGDPMRIDTNGMSTATLVIDWTKVGAGTQRCSIVSNTNSNIVLITFGNLASGLNTNATVDIPTNAENRIDTFKPMCRSTTSTDDPIWLTGQVLLRP